jgi:fluoroquinolone resistance protein
MPAKPDVVDEELVAWTGSLAARFEIEDAVVSGDFADVHAAGGRIMRSRLDRVVLTGSRLRSVALIDVVAGGCEASGADWSSARLRRVVFEGGRLAGLQLLEAELEDVVFRDCRLSLATFHSARLRNVTFERCDLNEAFLGLGRMQAVRFDACQLVRADFTGAALTRVDLRGSELDPAGDVSGLRGAIVDTVQLAGLAPLLARAAGIAVSGD